MGLNMSASGDYDDRRLLISNSGGHIVLSKSDCVELLDFLIEGSRFRDIRSASTELTDLIAQPPGAQ